MTKRNWKFKHCKDCYYRSNMFHLKSKAYKETCGKCTNKNSCYSYCDYDYKGTYEDALDTACRHNARSIGYLRGKGYKY